MNRIIKAPLKFLESLADRVISAAGALIFAQLPAFIVQYQQRLGGHVDELRRIVEKYKLYAANNDRTVEEYINIHLQSNVKEIASTGRLMQENLARFSELSEALREITDSTGITKLFMFFKNLDLDIYRGTMKNFVPGITFNTDAILYSVIGIIVFMSIYFLVKRSVTALISRI